MAGVTAPWHCTATSSEPAAAFLSTPLQAVSSGASAGDQAAARGALSVRSPSARSSSGPQPADSATGPCPRRAGR